MMRKGPLDRYPADLILREASTTRLSGVIEFDGPASCTLYLVDGDIYHAHAGVGPAGWSPAEESATVGDEAHERDAAVRLIEGVLGQREGWYSHHPLHHHASRGTWSWDTLELLQEARSRHRATLPLARWSESAVTAIAPIGSAPAPDADGWQVLVAMTRPTEVSGLANLLGWDHERLAAALDGLEMLGLVSGPLGARNAPPTARPRTVPPTTSRPAVAAKVLPFPDQVGRRATWRRKADSSPSA